MSSDAIGSAIGEVILARRSTEEALRAAQFALEEIEREKLELQKRLLESDVRWYSEEQLAERIRVLVRRPRQVEKEEEDPVHALRRAAVQILVIERAGDKAFRILEVKPKAPAIARPRAA